VWGALEKPLPEMKIFVPPVVGAHVGVAEEKVPCV